MKGSLKMDRGGTPLLPVSQVQPSPSGQHWLLGMHCPLHSYWPAAGSQMWYTHELVVWAQPPCTIPSLASPAGQAQLPAWHSLPPWQVLLQALQWAASVCRLVSQLVPPSAQLANPGLQAHAPAVHSLLPVQAVVQAPQCWLSDCRLTQTAPVVSVQSV